MRANMWVMIFVLGCKPSATVERTMPVANLQSHRTVALRVHTSAFAAQGQAMFLENAVVQKLRQKCSFDQIGKPGAQRADLVVDLNITKVARGGGGLISNPNTAFVDTLLVLTDGLDGELLGTATIHGKSSGMIVNNNVPETQAIEVTAQTIADMLAKSGCSGPRVAKAQPVENPGSADPVGPGSSDPVGPVGPVGPAVDETQRAAAEALNDQGKEKLYAADLPGALALFQQANAKLPDARYAFNICLTFAAQENWSEAMNACRGARQLSPRPDLAAKIDQRITNIQARLGR
ncbi:MAG: hypothetical protein KF773_19215 [Deltaproteobacteria bacterium]|nr:hypothetical protein [Deltaproteobacteria bacterium]MCW5804934.1 hypothetical protein [Deltaproteobacteria bacterium]